jgi:electron transport complex protein RnfE
MTVGFAFALFCLGAAREVLGSGSLFGISLFGPRFEPWVIMILPPGGFLMLGLILLLFNSMKTWRRQPAEIGDTSETAERGAA